MKLSPNLAWGAIAAAVLYQALMAVTVLVKPELQASWMPPSEWAIGAWGWLQTSAFLVSSVGYLLLWLMVWRQLKSWGGYIGLGLLTIVVIGTLGVGVFTTDSISVPMDHLTSIGTLHVAFGTSQLFLLPWAALLLSLHLARKNPVWSPVRRVVFWSGFLPLATLVIVAVVLALMESADHHAGPDVPIGWPSRALLLSYSVWLVILASQVIRLVRKPA